MPVAGETAGAVLFIRFLLFTAGKLYCFCGIYVMLMQRLTAIIYYSIFQDFNCCFVSYPCFRWSTQSPWIIGFCVLLVYCSVCRDFCLASLGAFKLILVFVSFLFLEFFWVYSVLYSPRTVVKTTGV